MITHENFKGLENLIIASLISCGDVTSFKDENYTLEVPFEKDKSFYLSNYLKHNGLYDFVLVEPTKGQFKIPPNTYLNKLVHQWYQDGNKIFSKKLDPKLLNYHSIILCINLFGSRKIEGISVPTNVDKRFLRTITYCIEKCIHVSVIPGRGQIKIPDVPNLFIDNVEEINAIDSTELANYLTNQEINKLIFRVST
ncbi:hypothetical protein ACFFIX_20450 [Metabacillus herbersteinensis]|uniref:Uncharacterized protein n=1 Tax=Metabacillus herbersteinensis TaxID=283816 RepID=A0ABV6GJ77_9BACI